MPRIGVGYTGWADAPAAGWGPLPTKGVSETESTNAIDRAARLMRAPLAGGEEELVLERVRPFLWSVMDTRIVFVTRGLRCD